MSDPSEVQMPQRFCISSVHDDAPVVATWLSDVDNEKDQALCSSCHFLFKRLDRIGSDARIPVATMAVTLPSNLEPEQLSTEIRAAELRARVKGYWSSDSLYIIRNVDGAVVVTFRRTGPVYP